MLNLKAKDPNNIILIINHFCIRLFHSYVFTENCMLLYYTYLNIHSRGIPIHEQVLQQ